MNTRTDYVHALRGLRGMFESKLSQLGKLRHLREDIVSTPYGPELEWAQFERAEMLKLINKEREECGKPLLEQDEVDRVERQACGHVDYAAKFSLYCAELVLR